MKGTTVTICYDQRWTFSPLANEFTLCVLLLGNWHCDVTARLFVAEEGVRYTQKEQSTPEVGSS